MTNILSAQAPTHCIAGPSEKEIVVFDKDTLLESIHYIYVCVFTPLTLFPIVGYFGEVNEMRSYDIVIDPVTITKLHT